ncbi:MAG: ATP-binding cassette domain-containing protein, partial [Spirochaetota bacterium]
MNREKDLIFELDRVSLRVRDKKILEDTTWKVMRGEHWAVLGPNGAGKSTLVRCLTGDTPVIKGRLKRGSSSSRGKSVGYVSFELEQEVLRREYDLDDCRHFRGAPDSFKTVAEFLKVNGEPFRFQSIKFMGLEELIDRSLRFLSSGELRKVFIARALRRKPELLILDEPFDGLDESSRQVLTDGLRNLAQSGVGLILVTHRKDEIFPEISHVICVKDGAVFAQGSRLKMLKPGNLHKLYRLPAKESAGTHAICRKRGVNGTPRILVEFRNVSVDYDGRKVISNLSWKLKAGENWCILGPNGSGKTTILNLITVENLKAYANDIRLFGRPRGEGKSIWDIRRRIGILTQHLQTRYRKNLSVREVILSGFFDSIGLYRRYSGDEERRALETARALKIEHLKEMPFNDLSFGERRLVLIARALVKSPELLILDEPLHGLDPVNKARVLEAV